VPHRHILTDVTDGIGTLTLNRPEKLNAYTTEMGEEVMGCRGQAMRPCAP
jgi:enoyl-CoA hydratase/carnithine racemase